MPSKKPASITTAAEQSGSWKLPRASIVLFFVGLACMLCKEFGPSVGEIALFLYAMASLGLLLAALALLITAISLARRASAVHHEELPAPEAKKPPRRITPKQERTVLIVSAVLLFAFSAAVFYAAITGCWSALADAAAGPEEAVVTLTDYREDHHTGRHQRWRSTDLYLDFEGTDGVITVHLKEQDADAIAIADLRRGPLRLTYYPHTRILAKLLPSFNMGEDT